MEDKQTSNSRSNIPENNPSKAMDSKKEVQQSPDPKTDQDFPGYPHYPAKEDIMNQGTSSHRVDSDLENYGTGSNQSGVNQQFLSGSGNDRSEAENTTNNEMGVPQNVSNEDLDNDLPGTDLDEAASDDR